MNESVSGSEDGIGGDGDGSVVEFGFDGFGGGVEDKDLVAAAASPEAVELAVYAFEVGEEWGEVGEPVCIERYDVLEF